ncbi:MAG: hypothetical protein IKO39_01725 [Treponema sp.]|nr:hypothetical protein [Treponema sp.]
MSFKDSKVVTVGTKEIAGIKNQKNAPCKESLPHKGAFVIFQSISPHRARTP